MINRVMSNISVRLEKNSFKKSIIVNMLIYSLLNLFFEASIKVDDYLINVLLYGLYDGAPSTINLYINPLMARILSLLFNMHSFPWFTLLQVGSCFIALCVIYYYIEKYNRFIPKSWIIVLLLCISYDFYIKITFTKTAGITILAGILLTLLAINELKNMIMVILGIVLALWGSLFRYDMLLFTIGSVVIIIFYRLLNEERKVLFLIKNVILFLIIIGFGKLLLIEGQQFVKENNDWNEYKEENAVNALLYNYGQIVFQKYTVDLEEYAISENDFELIKRSMLIDSKYYSEERLTALANKYSKKNRYTNYGASIKKAFKVLLEEPLVFVLIPYIIIIMYNCNNNTRLLILVQICYMIFEILYMVLRGRTTHHVNVILIVCSVVGILSFTGRRWRELESFHKGTTIYLIICLLLFFNSYYENMLLKSYDVSMNDSKSIFYKEYSIENDNRLKRIAKDSNSIYVIDSNCAKKLYYIFGAYDVPIREEYKNIYFTNIYFFPQQRGVLKKNNVNNLIVDAVDNDNVRFCMVDEAPYDNLLIDFLEEHYSVSVYTEELERVDNIVVFILKTKK